MDSSNFYQISDGTRQSLRNPQADLETIESIDPLYFDHGADVNIHELKVSIMCFYSCCFYINCSVVEYRQYLQICLKKFCQ